MVTYPIKRGLSLRVSLLLFLVLPMIGVFTYAAYYSLQYLEKTIEKGMQGEIELIARSIRGPLEYSLEQGQKGNLNQTLASVFRFGRIYGAYIYDRNGKQIAASGPPETALGDTRLAELAAGGNRMGEYQETEDREVYSYFMPLSDSFGSNTGLLQLTQKRRDFQDYIHQVRRQALFLLLPLSLVLLGIVVYGHHRVIGRNLGQLVRSMSRIESGDRTHRAFVSGPWEIQQLAKGMNAMLDSIERSEQELGQKRREQAKLEHRLQQSQKMAAIGQLAAGVAHELGTPLSVVSGKAQRMLRKLDLPDQVIDVFREIRDAVQRTEHIVRQLLDFGRGNQPKLRPVALDDIASCIADQVAEIVHQKPVSLELTGPRPAPTLAVDRVRMEQALVNLVRNAIQSTSAGGQVRLEWFSTEQEVGFLVSDDGPGVPDEHKTRLFEPFFTTKPVNQGSGMGLSVALAVVRDHGGRIEVEQSDLGGALFKMTFKPMENRDESS